MTELTQFFRSFQNKIRFMTEKNRLQSWVHWHDIVRRTHFQLRKTVHFPIGLFYLSCFY